MTDRNGGVATQLIDALHAAHRQSGRGGSLARFVSGAITASVTYKNEGWYAAGAAWETWLTSDAPATVPPSGHTLTYLQHMTVQ